jgi:hypothetical protein
MLFILKNNTSLKFHVRWVHDGVYLCDFKMKYTHDHMLSNVESIGSGVILTLISLDELCDWEVEVISVAYGDGGHFQGLCSFRLLSKSPRLYVSGSCVESYVSGLPV